MILGNTIKEYLTDIKVSISFGMLLVFVILLSFFGNLYISTGSVLIEYGGTDTIFTLIGELIALIVFLIAYSFFITLIIFSIRKRLSNFKIDLYWKETINKFTTKIFLFYLIIALISLGIGTILTMLGAYWLTPIILAIITIPLLFVPQSIVIDEEGLVYGILNNLDYVKKNKTNLIYVMGIGLILITGVAIIEWLIDLFTPLGGFIGLVITMTLVLPLIETMKTYMYLFKYSLVKSPTEFHYNMDRKNKR